MWSVHYMKTRFYISESETTSEIEKFKGTAKSEGVARAGIKSFSHWTLDFLALKGLITS